MTIRAAIAVIAGCALVLASVGAGVGYLLGEFVPGYYRSLFRASREPGFDPVSVGVGQGLTQGTAGGVVVGVALVAIFCWRQTRLDQLVSSSSGPGGPLITIRPLARRLLLVTSSLLALGFCTSSGVVVGLLGGQRGAYHRRYLEEQRVLIPVLTGDPAFAGVILEERSDGGAFLYGDVPTHPDRDRLIHQVEQAIGRSRSRSATGAVGVSRP